VIHFRCPHCQKRLRVKDHFAGQMTACPCGQRVQIPAVPTVVTAEEPPLLATLEEDPPVGLREAAPARPARTCCPLWAKLILGSMGLGIFALVVILVVILATRTPDRSGEPQVGQGDPFRADGGRPKEPEKATLANALTDVRSVEKWCHEQCLEIREVRKATNELRYKARVEEAIGQLRSALLNQTVRWRVIIDGVGETYFNFHCDIPKHSKEWWHPDCWGREVLELVPLYYVSPPPAVLNVPRATLVALSKGDSVIVEAKVVFVNYGSDCFSVGLLIFRLR
jgi:hypothetical protein